MKVGEQPVEVLCLGLNAEVAHDILQLIGRTPMVELSRITKGLRPRVLAKLEFYNPGGSVKDRIAVAMISEAERRGQIRPGFTIIEPTSGNTGMGLALVGILRGYKVLCTVPDKVAPDKIDLLRAVGATVVVTPSGVPSNDPESYVMVARRLAEENPRSFVLNQYANPANPEAHFLTTGPEIWEQTHGSVDVFVAGVGTGGTITGAGRYLKSRNPRVRVVGVDPEGSILASEFSGRTGTARPYRVEGIGEDFVPDALDMHVLDEMLTVSDKDAFLTCRRLAREEGILAGGSSGAAVCGALRVAETLDGSKTVVVILPDSGRSYTDKVYSDDWMEAYGFMGTRARRVSVEGVLRSKPEGSRRVIGVGLHDTLATAIRTMTRHDVSQLPVIEKGRQMGSVTVASVVRTVARRKRGTSLRVEGVMEAPLPTVEERGTLLNPAGLMKDRNAVVVVRGERVVGIITTIDVINYLAGS